MYEENEDGMKERDCLGYLFSSSSLSLNEHVLVRKKRNERTQITL